MVRSALHHPAHHGCSGVAAASPPGRQPLRIGPGTPIPSAKPRILSAKCLLTACIHTARMGAPSAVSPPESRCALVTGAARGIGRGLAEDLLRRGFRVIAADI